ncbi:MAG TPA: nicotinate-nucleotide--dimethylbenzimidazole phosphoribosyltransferase [Acidimicrobiales bacterium]|nr:nicotinate-nucleotide--dimethylbenzimidazole phosphoribosyltransferase [Acidimicrobiales bacterium]
MDRQVRDPQQGPLRPPPRAAPRGPRRADRAAHLSTGGLSAAAAGRPFERAVGALQPLDDAAAADAAALQHRLAKPRGSLGRLEEVGVHLAAIAGISPPPLPEPATVAVFAADHGVLVEGVSPWPREVTAQMVANFCAGGAAINVLAAAAGARVVVVDVGVASPLDPAAGLVDRKVCPGTANLVVEPAMSVAQAEAALDVGARTATEAVAAGAGALATGDMGIGNTTAAAALVAAYCGRPPGEVTGRGTGIDDAAWAHKVDVVGRALARAAVDGTLARGPLSVLASLGGLEIAALAGFVVGGAAARVPVVVDGVIALAATLAAAALAPAALSYCLAGHRSTEPGATVALSHLGLQPLLDLGLRLGEGTGACLALPLVSASARVLNEMATFDAAGVTDKG